MNAQLLTAAFFMEGLHEASPGPKVKPNYDVLIETWGICGSGADPAYNAYITLGLLHGGPL